METFLFRTKPRQSEKLRDKERMGQSRTEQNPSGCFPVSSGDSKNEEVTFRVVAGNLISGKVASPSSPCCLILHCLLSHPWAKEHTALRG